VLEPSGPCTAAACRRLSRARIVRAPRAGACGIRRPQPVRSACPGSRTTPCSRRRWRGPDLGAICTPCSCRRSSRSTRLPAAQLTAVCWSAGGKATAVLFGQRCGAVPPPSPYPYSTRPARRCVHYPPAPNPYVTRAPAVQQRLAG
jgi:hypothetical protein